MGSAKNKKIKRIGIDARFYGAERTGIGRYVKEVVDNIIKKDQDNEYVIFLRQDNFNEFSSNDPRIKKVLTDIKWYTIKEQLFMTWLLYRERIDLMHFPHFNMPILYPGKFVITIHDLILTKHPTQRATKLSPLIYKIKNLGYKLVIYLALKRAGKIIAVSEYTKNDIINKFSVNGNKIEVIYEGIASSLKMGKKNDDKKIVMGYNTRRPYLLYVGNAYPHKNLENLIRVFSKIREKNTELALVLVGKEDYFYKRLKEFSKTVKNGNFVVFPGFVPDEHLSSFYKQAKAYVFPSLFEGFGLPPLEAMVHGCPVVSSDKTCLPEVLGNAALYFNPDDKQAMADKIEKVISDNELRRQLVEKGYKRVKKYSWNECAKQTLEVYKSANLFSSPCKKEKKLR